MTSFRNVLYFAPGIKFSEVDINGEQLPIQYESRVRGLYLNPALELADKGHAFAAGLLLVCCIDALAKLQVINIAENTKLKVGERFKLWCQSELASFKENDLAKAFYENFRNGLVHEARIKNGGFFSFETDSTVKSGEISIIINPKLLIPEIDEAIITFTGLLKSGEKSLLSFSNTLKDEFKDEFR